MNLANLKEKSLIKIYNPFYAILALGVLCAMYFGITQGVWAVTGEFTNWAAALLLWAGVDVNSLEYFKITHPYKGSIFTRTSGLMIIGMFVASFLCALWANNFKWRLPSSKLRIAQALLGGILAGFGARLGMGCNLASFFTGIPAFSLHAWGFSVFMIFGIYLASKLITSKYFIPKIRLKTTAFEQYKSDEARKNKRFFQASILFVLFIIICVCLIIAGFAPLGKEGFGLSGVVLIFGFCFGFLISRGQVCFTSAFRDLFLFGRSNVALAFILAMMISCVLIFSYIGLGIPGMRTFFGLNIALGGFIFGFGIVLAGGCECGWMYRAMQGQVHFMIVGVGNIIGAGLLTLVWGKVAPILAYPYPRINLAMDLPGFSGLFIVLGLLCLLGAFVMIVGMKVAKRLANA